MLKSKREMVDLVEFDHGLLRSLQPGPLKQKQVSCVRKANFVRLSVRSSKQLACYCAHYLLLLTLFVWMRINSI